MKKIVTLMTVAAIATSLFAADVSAQLKLGTNLWSNKAVLTTPASSGWDTNNTYYKLSVNGDKSGAEYCIWDEDAKFHGLSLWFKPVDSLKVTVGNNTSASMTKGTFAWWANTAKLENVMGIKLNADVAGVALEFLSANNALLDTSKSGYDMVGNFWAGATYGMGDAGTIQVYATKGADINAYGVGGWMKVDGLGIGLAYDHMPWQQTGFYADVIGCFNPDFSFKEVAGQVGGQYSANGLAARLTVPVAYGHKYGAADATFSYGAVAQVSYAIEAYTPYLKVMAHEIMDKKLEADLGVTTSIGACELETWVQINMNFAASTTTVAVPVTFKVSF